MSRQQKYWNKRKKDNNYSNCMNALKIYTRTEKTIHSHNSWEHERLKCQIIYLLKRAGHVVVAEGEFKNGGRADIIDCCCAVVYEVLNTETLLEFDGKNRLYPSFLTVVPVMVEEYGDKLEELIKFLGVD